MKKILKFGAPWCGPCKMQDKILDELISEGYDVKKINVDEQEEIAYLYEVRNLPVIIILEDDKEVNRFVGLTQKKELIEALQ